MKMVVAHENCDFLMRPRISIRGSVRPSVRPSVHNTFFSNARKRVFSTSQGKGKAREEGDVGRGGGRRGEGGVTRGSDASDVWRDQTCSYL